MHTKTDRMDHEEFREIAAMLGLGRTDMPKLLDISERSANGYWSGGLNIPRPTGQLMRTFTVLTPAQRRKLKLPF